MKKYVGRGFTPAANIRTKNGGSKPPPYSVNLIREIDVYMKATGIVRRIDDLGRVVIPKEIRRTMRIREGDPLEIFTDTGGEVVFKKYSPVGEMGEFASQYADVLYRACGHPVIICDRDHVTASAGITKKDLPSPQLSASLEALIETRRTHILTGESPTVFPTDDSRHRVSVCAPILGAGDIGGAVCLLSGDEGVSPSDGDVRLTQVAATFLGKQLES